MVDIMEVLDRLKDVQLEQQKNVKIKNKLTRFFGNEKEGNADINSYDNLKKDEEIYTIPFCNVFDDAQKEVFEFIAQKILPEFLRVWFKSLGIPFEEKI